MKCSENALPSCHLDMYIPNKCSENALTSCHLDISRGVHVKMVRQLFLALPCQSTTISLKNKGHVKMSRCQPPYISIIHTHTHIHTCLSMQNCLTILAPCHHAKMRKIA